MNILTALNILSVLVTGSNRGLGLEFVRQLSQLENPPQYIFASYRNESTNQNLTKIRDSSTKSQVILIKMDVRNLEDIEAAKKTIEETVGDRGLGLLINNAGVLSAVEFPHLTAENMEFHLRTNTIAPVIVCQTLLPLLQQASRNSDVSGLSMSKAGVLNLESITGSITNTGVSFTEDLIVPSYKVSKAGLNMGMRVVAAKVKDDEILVVSVHPGWVKTDMGGRDIADIEPEEAISGILETLPKLNEADHGSFIDRFGKEIPF